MAITLVINSGSTSKKFALYDSKELLISFRFEETGTGFDVCIEKAGTRSKCQKVSASVYTRALTEVIRISLEERIIYTAEDIQKIGVRVVAPGIEFQKHVQVTDDYIASLKNAEKFAPLHIPVALSMIEEVQGTLPEAELIAVSDSAFHGTLPQEASEYSLPRVDVETYGFRRYGYHGISVASLAHRLPQFFSAMPEKTIVCHVGGGISVTALQNGVSTETSMGFTPASGLMMSGRAGDLDAGVLTGIIDTKKLRGIALHEYLHAEGGLRGVSGVKDMRLVLKKREEGNEEAMLAIDMLIHQFTKIIGSYYTVLGGLDAIVLTATAAERNAELRALLLSRLSVLGVILDEEKNDTLINREGMIHSENSSVKIGVMKTDEMGEIAQIVHQM